MNLEDAIARRHMVRAFSSAPIDPALLESILDLARRAPSAGNSQAASFLVLDEPDAVTAYWDTTLPAPRRARFRWQQLLDAPVLVVIATDPSAYVSRYAEPDKGHPSLGQSTEAWGVPYWWVDAGAVAQNLLLLAVDRGLGACLFGLFDHEEPVKSRFGVPVQQRLVATIALGHPLSDQPGRSQRRSRQPIANVTHHNRWPS